MTDIIPEASIGLGSLEDAVAALRSIRNLQTCRSGVGELRSVGACGGQPASSSASIKKAKIEPKAAKAAPSASMPRL